MWVDLSKIHRSLITYGVFFFFFNDTPTTEIYTLSLHDALPIPIDLNPAEQLPPTPFAQRLAAKAFVVSVEIDPPRGLNPAKCIAGAELIKAAGADAINIGDSPMARVRMSALSLALMIRQQVGIDTLIHFKIGRASC